MNKPHKHAELIHKWADGFEIEFKDEANGKWKKPPGVPQWNEATEYRIKPEPQYPKTNMSYIELENFFKAENGRKPTREVLRDIANGAIARAIHDGQIIVAPGQIED